MSYQAGIGPGIGITPREPHVACDGCGCTHAVTGRSGPKQWFINGRPPPKWQGKRPDDGRRTDYCPDCVETGRKP